MERIPILKIGGLLLVSIQVDMHDRLALTLQNDLTAKIVETGAHGVIIDISALEMVDSFIGRMLSNIAGMSRLLGADTVVAGMQPSVAITLVELGLSLSGPGMSDLALCFEDGYSTAGSAGSGLGAIGRLSQCDVFTHPGKGTAVLARIHRHGANFVEGPFLTGGVAVPLAGEAVSGDDYSFRRDEECLLAMLVDGLGHGPLAATCAARAIQAFQQSKERSAAGLIDDIHLALRGTRGAAVSVARLDPAAREIRFAGVGNVLGIVAAPGVSKSFVAMPGIAGHRISAVREFTYPWPVASVVLIYSDGIGSHWSLDEYEGLDRRDPSLISGVIYRDRKRGRDDASVLAVRERAIRERSSP